MTWKIFSLTKSKLQLEEILEEDCALDRTNKYSEEHPKILTVTADMLKIHIGSNTL